MMDKLPHNLKHELSGCPFCNAEAILLQDDFTQKYAVWCSTCQASVEWFDTEAEAISAWNRRHVDYTLLTEAMELLKAANETLDALSLTIRESTNSQESCCNFCAMSEENTEAIGECAGYEIENCFVWQYKDRLEKLRAAFDVIKQCTQMKPSEGGQENV